MKPADQKVHDRILRERDRVRALLAKADYDDLDYNARMCLARACDQLTYAAEHLVADNLRRRAEGDDA